MGKKNGGKKHAAGSAPVSAEECFEDAEVAFMQDDLDTARAKYIHALKLEPDNAEFLSGYGAFLSETGRVEEAVGVLQRAAAAAPDTGFEKYMYLGQILEGSQAESAIRKGISILRADLEQANSAAPTAEDEDEVAAVRAALSNQLSSSLCCLAEQLMSAAAEEEGAGEEAAARLAAAVEPLLAEARTLDPASPEPLQDAANLALMCGRGEEAASLLRASLALWFKPTTEGMAEDGSGSEGEEDLGSQDSGSGSEGEEEPPSFEFRFETARMLLELDIELDSAAAVLGGLLEENDTLPAVHLLLGEALARLGEYEEAGVAVEEGLAAARAAAAAGGEQDVDVFTSLQELGTEIQELIQRGGSPGDAAPMQEGSEPAI